jgi:ribosome maturation factor rimP
MRVMDPEKIADFLRPIGDSLGVEVVEAEFRQGQNPSLTVYIDRAGGIDLDACEAFHNAIDEPLDELDPTYGAPYTLNVSSLGLDRPFRKAADFEKNIGEEVEVKLYASVRGKKYWEGILLSYDGEAIRLRAGKETFTLELKQIAKINKAIHFE